jgi:hypothetical protein
LSFYKDIQHEASEAKEELDIEAINKILDKYALSQMNIDLDYFQNF